MRLKHNKKRNTAFVYEALCRELTKSIIKKNKNRQNKIILILKENFYPSSPLTKELALYKSLYETTDIEKMTAEKILTEAKAQYNKLDKREIFKQQSGLIKKINTLLSKNIYNNFVPNYKNIASIYSIFNLNAPVKEKVLLEEKIVNHMSASAEIKENTMQVPMDNIIYNTFVNKFNEEYSNALINEQRILLSKYISSFADNGLELKIFLNEEISRLKTVLKSSRIDSNTETDKKMKRVLNILDDFKKTKIDKSMVEDIIKIQQLVREIENDD